MQVALYVDDPNGKNPTYRTCPMTSFSLRFLLGAAVHEMHAAMYVYGLTATGRYPALPISPMTSSSLRPLLGA